MNVIRDLGAGVLAGVAGTAAMDLLWYRRYRAQGGKQRFREWEFADDVTGWESASAPGKVGLKLLRLVTRRTPPERWARPTTNAVHWATGTGWGVQYAVARSIAPHSRLLPLALGPAAWLASYAVLPLLRVYRPIWRYDARTLAEDLSAHLVFGAVTAAAFALLGVRRNAGGRRA